MAIDSCGSNEKMRGQSDLAKDEAKDLYDDWVELGKPKPDSKRKQDGFVDPDWLIPWPLIPSAFGCAELDCNQNGVPDHEETDLCQ